MSSALDKEFAAAISARGVPEGEVYSNCMKAWAAMVFGGNELPMDVHLRRPSVARRLRTHRARKHDLEGMVQGALKEHGLILLKS